MSQASSQEPHMAFGPFLRRELTTSVRQGGAYHDRIAALVLVMAIVAGYMVAWRWFGWERASVEGAAVFGWSTFGLIVVAQVCLAITTAARQVAPAIASERDRKSLDAVLATRLSAADVVLGAMAAGLFRYANGLAATLPVVVLVVFLGGIDLRLVWLAGAGLASTAFAAAALAVVASVGGRTGVRAVASAAGLIGAWLVLPLLVAVLKAGVWPSGPRWIAPAALWGLDSSPIGVGADLFGLVPRPGSLVERVVRMIALQVAGGSALTLWAVWRLRPASRSLYDDDVRTLIRRLSRAIGRRRSRPPCGDDPVLWNELHANRCAGGPARVARGLVYLVGYGLLAWGTSWFARPAFEELAERGYGPAREAFAMPDGNAFARVVVDKTIVSAGASDPGQARLIFNVALRQASGWFLMLYVVTIASGAAAGVTAERDRDTWLGLLATTLTGWEIVRAKLIGAAWKSREGGCVLVALWTVGLLAGAVHPLGFLAAVAGLAASYGFFAALGVSLSMRVGPRRKASDLITLLYPLVTVSSLVILLPGRAGVVLSAGSVPFLASCSLFSYEDVHAAIQSGPFPQFAVRSDFKTGVGARLVMATWLLGTLAQAAGTVYLTRSLCREFDAIAGRPTRHRGDTCPS
jgi:hypothetical protein